MKRGKDDKIKKGVTTFKIFFSYIKGNQEIEEGFAPPQDYVALPLFTWKINRLWWQNQVPKQSRAMAKSKTT